jgi:hypothetical protein
MSSSQRKWLLVGVIALLLLGGGTFWAVQAFSPKPEPAPEPVVVEMKGAMQELVQDLRNGTPMENKTALLAKMAKMGQEMRDLSPEQRKLAMKNFGMVATEYMKNYFSLPPEEQTKQLDSVIDMFQLGQKMASLFGGRRGNRDGQADTGGAGGNSSGDQAQGQNGGGPGGDNMTPEARDAQRREMISSMSTPEQRAMFAEYGRQLQQRAQQRGVTLGPPGRSAP